MHDNLSSQRIAPTTRRLEAVWIAGPDAGGRVALRTDLDGTGSWVIGRASTARIRCADADLEPHHATLTLDHDGTVRVQQLCGRLPITVGEGTVDSSATVESDQHIAIGGSVLVVREAAEVVRRPLAGRPTPGPAASSDGSRRVPLVRSPRALVTFEPTTVEVPRLTSEPTGIGGGLVPTLLGVAAAGVLALLAHQVMFLLFGLMGAVVAIGTWGAQRIGLVRSRSGVARSNRLAVEEFSTALAAQRDGARAARLANGSTIERAVEAMGERSKALWSVRATDADAFDVCIGHGDGFWTPDVGGIGNATADMAATIDATARLGVVPMVATLGAGSVVAVVGGDRAVAVVRAMIVQLAARCGPADWRLAIVSDRGGLWSGLEFLAHLDAAGGRVVAAADVDELVQTLHGADQRHLVVVVDGPELLDTRTSPLRRLLAAPTPTTACIVVCSTEAEVPALATSALMVGRHGGRWLRDTRVSALAEPVRTAGISVARARAASEAIADLADPEDGDGTSSIPTAVGLLGLLLPALASELTSTEPLMDAPPSKLAATIASHWAGLGSDPSLRTPLGTAADGVVDLDLVRDGPHALVAGTTGAGKSELLRSLVVGMAAMSTPEHVSFVLVDYKGGSTFDACVRLPHVVGVVTDLDERLAARALRSLEAELRRREHVLRDAGVGDLASYRARRVDLGGEALPRLVVVIDEFATLAVQLPEFIAALLGIAQRGRSLGVHLVLATQRPTGVVNDDMRANTNLRIALRVQDAVDSLDVVGDHAAASLPRSVPGRAVMRLGREELITFQAACCSTPMVTADGPTTELAVLVDAIAAATAALRIASPYRPWLEPLSSSLDAGALASGHASTEGAVGIIDDADHQRRLPLRWGSGDAHLLVAGATGSGTSTALLAIATVIAQRAPRDGTAMYVIDALGDTRLDAVTALHGCAALVRVHERERLIRLLGHVTDVIARRKAGGASGGGPGADPVGDVVVLIDGLGALRDALEADDLWDQLAQLDLLVAEGLTVGVRVALTVSRCGAVPVRMLGQIAHRWVLRLADPLDAATLGVPARSVPAVGCGRLFDTASGCEAQIITPVLPSVDAAQGAHDGTIGNALIAELPRSIAPNALPCPGLSGNDVLVPIAVDFDALQPSVLPINAGEHVLIVGPSRSGRTTALATIAAGWGRARDDGWIGSVTVRRSGARIGNVFPDVDALLADAPTDRAVLVVVDDAELVDDPNGALAARITARRDGFTVITAGRPEALRASYGHWTGAVRRSRLGLVMAGANELDADLLGTVLPRRLPISTRPGLAWLVVDGERHLVQVACGDTPDELRPGSTAHLSVGCETRG